MTQELEAFAGTDGAAVSTTWGIFDSGTNGTGSWVFENAFTAGAGYQGSKISCTTSSPFTRNIKFGSLISDVWLTVKFQYDTFPTNSIALLQVKSNTTIRAECQMRSTHKMRMRNGTTAVGSDFTNACATGTAYYLSWHLVNGTGQSLYLYDSTGALIESQTGQTYNKGTFDNVSIGLVNAPGLAVVLHIARPGYDTAAEIPPPSNTVSADAGASAAFAGSSDIAKVLPVDGAPSAAFAATADATRTTPATGTGSASFTATAAAAVMHPVDGAATAAFTGAAGVARTATAAGAPTVTFAGSAGAALAKGGAGVGGAAFAGSGSVNLSPGAVTGSSSAAFATGAAVSVTTPVTAAASAAFTAAAGAAVFKAVDAAATATFTGTAVVTVTRTVTGSASAVFAGAAQVVLVRNAQASAQAAFAATATAAKPAARYRGWGLPL